ncbi:hypothetical protein Hanom_Chr06g00501081 [Helianthus anomalus]
MHDLYVPPSAFLLSNWSTEHKMFPTNEPKFPSILFRTNPLFYPSSDNKNPKHKSTV